MTDPWTYPDEVAQVKYAKYLELQKKVSRQEAEIISLTHELGKAKDEVERLKNKTINHITYVSQAQEIRGLKNQLISAQAEAKKLRELLTDAVTEERAYQSESGWIDAAEGYLADPINTAPPIAPAPTENLSAASEGLPSSEWQACHKLPVTVHVRSQRPGETHVSTREGITPVKPDDLIMRGVSGEEYPIGKTIFEQTYRMGELPITPPITSAIGEVVSHTPYHGLVVKVYEKDLVLSTGTKLYKE